MSDLQTRFSRFVRARRLVSGGDRVIVALSGGVDSVVLLDLFRTSAQALKVDVWAAHFDHAMRADSAADAAWVAGLCEAWQVPLLQSRAQARLSGETEARLARYRFLQDAMRQCSATRIATAHHADDQIETVLLRLLRGTGMRGMAGIPLRRGPFIRPLLRFSKADLLEYAARRAIQFREDPTNEEIRYLRNRIRKTVMPALQTVQPAAGAAILALARHAARTENAWRSVLKQLEKELVLSASEDRIELARDVLLEYDPELRARVLRDLVRRFGPVPGRAQTKQLLAFCQNAESGTSFALRSVRVERVFDRFRIERAASAIAEDQALRVVGSAGSGELQLGGRRYVVAWSTAGEQPGNAEHFDVSALDAGLELRAWHPGDRIRLPYGTKKLKKLFVEQRIAKSERASIPVLADSHGRVLWVVGVARSGDAVPVNPDQILNITVQNAESG